MMFSIPLSAQEVEEKTVMLVFVEHPSSIFKLRLPQYPWSQSEQAGHYFTHM